MDRLVEWLSTPLIGSVIGILGILIGIVVAIFSYFKSKIVSKPCYTIENTKLIEMYDAEIPSTVTMSYNNEEIKRLYKTTIRFWNAGRKPILASDLVPEYIEVAFGAQNEKDVRIISVDVQKTRPQTAVNKPIIYENRILRFGFNFLEKADQIVITVVHTAVEAPTKIVGYVVGVPAGLVNVSERQLELQEMVDVAFGPYDSLVSIVLKALIKVLIKCIRW